MTIKSPTGLYPVTRLGVMTSKQHQGDSTKSCTGTFHLWYHNDEK
jgi:hypothetical protein